HGAAEGAGDRHAKFVVVIVDPLIVSVGEEDAQVRTARIDELANHERAESCRRAPVDVAAVVTGHVFAKRVEGNVARGQIIGGTAFEISNPPDGRWWQNDGSGVNMQVDGIGGDDLATGDAER